MGAKHPNELGLYDMSENVMEWCSDWYGSYPIAMQNNPTGASAGAYRVFRGGSRDGRAGYCRVTNRFNFSPDNSSNGLGFRLARSSE
ncbi:MAG: formylglycine-generating enzyme family protein [Prevotellaceae bacterium]|nr:formylglycine-generating enzyme family protein [Prevotellaceae bacterium]